MVDPDTVRRLGRLLAEAGRAHHAEFDGPHAGWPEWYASYILPDIDEIVGFRPTVAQVAGWLRTADERHRAEAPDEAWPPFYARLILRSVEG